LKVLAQHGGYQGSDAQVVKAPAGEDKNLLALIDQLRDQGKRVEVQLSGDTPTTGARIEKQNDQWLLIESD